MPIASEDTMYTAFEPAVQNRFIFLVDMIPAFMIKKADVPGVEMGEIKIDYINVYFKAKGKALWRDLALSLYNPISPSGQLAVMEWVRLHHESVTGRDGYMDMYKKDCSIQILDPTGGIASEWIIKGAFIKTANFGSYDWSTADPVQLEVTLGMDYCVLNY